MQAGEIKTDPIEGAFFNTQSLGSLSGALVREAIRDSLDDAVIDGPVTVRFAFHSRTGGEGRMSVGWRRWLAGLGDHLDARHADTGLRDTPAF